MITVDRFCLNRKVAPAISLDKTIPLVAQLGCHNLELRNDLYGNPDNHTILDHLEASKVKELLNSYDVNVKTINAIGNMDDPDKLDENLASLSEMLEITKTINLGDVVFCPVRSNKDSRSAKKRFEDAVENVKQYSQVLSGYGVKGLVEPLGFADSTLRTPWEGQKIIDHSGVDNFRLVADTFHYYLASVTKALFKKKVDPNYIGLVHLSAVFGDKPIQELDDQDRYMLARDDVMHSAEWAKEFEKSGYTGLYAFEPFSDKLKEWDSVKVKEEMRKSIKLVQEA